jgi:hypothetical protein
MGSITARITEYRFKTDFGDLDYGQEVDVGATMPIPKVKGLLTKFERG